jgi:hypothetical protein
VVLEHCQPHEISTLGSLSLAEGVFDRWEKTKKIIRYQNQSTLFQCSISHTQINPGLSLGPQGGSKSIPRTRIAMRPKLAGSCWFDAMTGKSLKKIGTETDRVNSTRKSAFA